MSLNKTIQSAIYLAGNKRKLFNDIQPHLTGKKVLIEPFAGSGTVSLNCASLGMFERYLCNDISTQLVNLHKSIQSEGFIDECERVHKAYPDVSKEAFYNITRADYNKDHSNLALLYIIMMRSNNNAIRFNSKTGDCNITWGDRERFDKQRLNVHKNLSEDIEWYNTSFVRFLLKLGSMLGITEHSPKDCVIYIDSPYSNTNANYNEKGGWTSQEDTILLDIVKELIGDGYKIVMSNVFENRGNTNQWLIDWCDENNDLVEVNHLDRDYGNSSSFKSNKKTDEVLIVSKEI